MLQTAAHIGIDEGRFWRMTPRQFHRHVEAFNARRLEDVEVEKMRQEAALYRAAWIVSTVMNFAGKSLPKGKTVKPDELLGRKPQGRRIADMAAARERANRIFRLKERFGKEI